MVTDELKALIADDDDLIRTFIVLNLTAMGVMDVVEASNGLQAWTLLKQQEFDLIVLDWRMPGKNGVEILRQLRSQGSQVPVIMVSAETKRDHVLEAIHAGATDYLVKPFDGATLRAKVAKVAEDLMARRGREQPDAPREKPES